MIHKYNENLAYQKASSRLVIEEFLGLVAGEYEIGIKMTVKLNL